MWEVCGVEKSKSNRTKRTSGKRSAHSVVRVRLPPFDYRSYNNIAELNTIVIVRRDNQVLATRRYKSPRLPALSTEVGLIIWASLGESSVSSMTVYFLYRWNWSASQRTVIRPPGKNMGRAFSSNRDLLVCRPSVSFLSHVVVLRYFVELVTCTKEIARENVRFVSWRSCVYRLSHVLKTKRKSKALKILSKKKKKTHVTWLTIALLLRAPHTTIGW